MNIQILGTDCSTCKKLYTKVKEISKEINPTLQVTYTTDIAELAKLGCMNSPVFVINNIIISEGKIPSTDEIKHALKTEAHTPTDDKNNNCDTSCCH
ncbi:MAG: thioredoxin family protein [Candidatus Magasanikbacteria bacterium]|nr:thioredoxin family protein [Candidatus Magasanikbacteria bacterium]